MNIGAVIELDFGDVADPTERFELIRKNVVDSAARDTRC